MTALYASQVMLWLAVGGLAFLTAVLARQVGVLHERLVPVGALSATQGPEMGQPAPMMRATTLAGRCWSSGSGVSTGRWPAGRRC